MITPTESCSGAATWNTFPNMSGEGLPPIGCDMRTEVTYLERSPYSISSLVPMIIGLTGALPGVLGMVVFLCVDSCISQRQPTGQRGAALEELSAVSSFRIHQSFLRKMTRRRNHAPADESIGGLAKSGECS